LQTDLEGCVRYCAEAGIQTAACPHWNGESFKSESETLRLAEFLEKCAAAFAKEGIPFGFHNHAHEFQTTEKGDVALELMIKNTENVFFQLDVYWAAIAGFDPAAFIEKHAGRFPLLHFKQMSAERTNVELDRGVLDFAAIKVAGEKQGTREFIVEQENHTLPVVESVTVGAEFMRKL
jgi:sugar phosphate isomerase/epimerase